METLISRQVDAATFPGSQFFSILAENY